MGSDPAVAPSHPKTNPAPQWDTTDPVICTPGSWVDVGPNLILVPPTSTLISAVTSGKFRVDPSASALGKIRPSSFESDHSRNRMPTSSPFSYRTRRAFHLDRIATDEPIIVFEASSWESRCCKYTQIQKKPHVFVSFKPNHRLTSEYHHVRRFIKEVATNDGENVLSHPLKSTLDFSPILRGNLHLSHLGDRPSFSLSMMH